MTTRNTIFSEISTTALEAMAVRFTAVATLTLWIYEYILTLDKEISLFWPSKLSAIKALFFANRYLPIIVSINNAYFLIFNSNENIHLCRPAAIFIGFLSFAGFVLAEVVLVIRLYVVWVARKSILMIAVSLLIIKTIISIVLTYYYLSSIKLPPVLIFASGCEGVFEVRTEWVALLLIFTFEMVILSLMLIAMRAHLQQNNSELVGILLRDGITYCLCIMCASLINVFMVRLSPPALSTLLIIMQGVVHNVLCSRLLLHFRSQGEARRRSQTSDGMCIALVGGNPASPPQSPL